MTSLRLVIRTSIHHGMWGAGKWNPRSSLGSDRHTTTLKFPHWFVWRLTRYFTNFSLFLNAFATVFEYWVCLRVVQIQTLEASLFVSGIVDFRSERQLKRWVERSVHTTSEATLLTESDAADLCSYTYTSIYELLLLVSWWDFRKGMTYVKTCPDDWVWSSDISVGKGHIWRSNHQSVRMPDKQNHQDVHGGSSFDPARRKLVYP